MSNIIELKQKPKLAPKLNIGVVIQARMTSNRFPGKSMAVLLGKPLIQWTIERAKQIKGPKGADMKIILAVPDTVESEPMLELASDLGVDNFCGSELNVLKRFHDTSNFFNLDFIIRLTGDCPFINPVVCWQVLYMLLVKRVDYSSNVYPKRTYQKGLDCEAFTRDCLDAAYKLSDQLGDFEHVTPWMQRTEEVKKCSIEQPRDMSHKNWCVDYPEDIQRIEDEISAQAKAMLEIKNVSTS